MNARANLPDGIRPREGFERTPRIMSDITEKLTSLANEDAGSSTHGRSGSESSGRTLVDSPLSGIQEMIDTGDKSSSFVQTRNICLVGGMKYEPHTRTVIRTSVKLERTESMHSFDLKTSTTSIPQRIRSLVDPSKK